MVEIDWIRRAIEPLAQSDPPECVDVGTAILVPIELPMGVEYEEVLDSVVTSIRKVSRLIDTVDDA